MTLPSIRVKSLTWHPHIEPVAEDEATEEQRAAMQVTPSSTKISPYVRTLAHDPESYVARTELFNAIMYAEEGLPQADRELGALVASMHNGCSYCCMVHAQRQSRHAGDTAAVSALFAGREELLSERDTAIADFARSLSKTPPAATADQVARLRENGMDDLEITDLIHSISIFGWANRLMHVLGYAEPAGKPQSKPGVA